MFPPDPEPKFRERAAEFMINVGRELRQKPTTAEANLWEHLRNRRLNDLKFRRQHPLENSSYVADFLCYEHRLVIELDGGIHDSLLQRQADAIRQSDIESLGYRVIRFKNDQLTRDLQGVLASILMTCETPSSSTTVPSPPSP